eukprot:NODE_79_length_2698_cov_462.899585_g50_i0.p1 GENE.NODE_79_length_2698_cov_462.899585_g50_i0~~NODE_79_length_2698_cov_462.899585_g50_i0.p1  ORF type:complete len:541 (+),score=145.07 NODE_79_length_2698_cov_462.899585_g50_i0:258-1880(+)
MIKQVDPDQKGDETQELLARPRKSGDGASVEQQLKELHTIYLQISEGANTFLYAEYKFMVVFMVIMTAIILGLIGPTADGWDSALFSALSFIIGGLTSIGAGMVGMKIAVFTNARTSIGCMYGGNGGYTRGFTTAFRGGIVMGFALTSLGLLNLMITLLAFRVYFKNDYVRLCGSVAAYGLGASSIAMFGRVGGGIFTKAADVGADLVGKVVHGLNEDDPQNPGVIADCIGDNVGDIAGMGADLFGSFAEATCAALVIASTDPNIGKCWASLMYPLLITAQGIVTCAICTLVATNIAPCKGKDDVEDVLKKQLFISTVLSTIGLFIVTYLALPTVFQLHFMNGNTYEVKYWYCFIAVAGGLWAGLAIGFMTEYFTSSQYQPVRDLAESCETGAATNVIYGIAVGYKSVIIPSISLALVIFIGYNMAGVYGVALGALGILSTMTVALTIDAYGPISDNAGGLVEMTQMGPEIRSITDDLDAAGNTTAAIGKGYAIGSAALVSLALYGAFLTRAFSQNDFGKPVHVNIIDPRTFFGLLIGML